MSGRGCGAQRAALCPVQGARKQATQAAAAGDQRVPAWPNICTSHPTLLETKRGEREAESESCTTAEPWRRHFLARSRRHPIGFWRETLFVVRGSAGPASTSLSVSDDQQTVMASSLAQCSSLSGGSGQYRDDRGAAARTSQSGARAAARRFAAADYDSAAGGSLYSLCARVPLIKSPAVRVPPPVTLPSSLHPLPPNLHEYFVYPFSLETMVLDAADRRTRAKREDMQRRAPGWSEGAGVLEPVRREAGGGAGTPFAASASTGGGGDGGAAGAGATSAGATPAPPQAVENDIDEMARMLDRLENKG